RIIVRYVVRERVVIHAKGGRYTERSHQGHNRKQQQDAFHSQPPLVSAQLSIIILRFLSVRRLPLFTPDTSARRAIYHSNTTSRLRPNASFGAPSSKSFSTGKGPHR